MRANGTFFLKDRLRASLERLNPLIPPDGITQAIEQLTVARGKIIPVNANQDVYQLLKSGAKVNIFDDNGDQVTEPATVVG